MRTYIFIYRCRNCGKKFSVIMRNTETDIQHLELNNVILHKCHKGSKNSYGVADCIHVAEKEN